MKTVLKIVVIVAVIASGVLFFLFPAYALAVTCVVCLAGSCWSFGSPSGDIGEIAIRIIGGFFLLCVAFVSGIAAVGLFSK
jgi:TRAP-type mannitol/chloroaromatic compound transport system permease small subunit